MVNLSNPKLSDSLFDLVVLWWVSGGDHGRSVVGFFGGVGYFGAGFFGGVVQVVGFVWHRSVGYGVEIAVRRGGNRGGAVVVVENWYGTVCMALLLASMGLR